jgi:pilus assembly protein Flp/PilA
MQKFLNMLAAMFDDKERGATATEYAMLIAFIVVTLVAVMLLFGKDVSTFFSTVGGTIAGWATSF